MPSACHEIIEDIEDLVSSLDVPARDVHRKGVTIRAKRRKTAKKLEEETEEVSDCLKSFIPGTQTIYMKTWGCTHNNSDSEYMAGLLSSYGYKLTDDKTEADLWLLNSCTVKNPAEDHFRNEVVAGRKAGKSVVVAGCVSQAAPKSSYLAGLSIVGVQHIDRVVHVVDETLKGNSVRLVGGRRGGGASLSMPKVRRNPLIEIVPINTGCLNQCTYCKTKHARGHLGSYPIEEIVKRVEQAFEEGVVEVWLTSEDTGAYGRDLGTDLPTLLKAIVPYIPQGSRLRLGMTNPPYILQHLEEMAEVLSHPRVYSFLHIPVQSGSDPVLKEMKREYTRREFELIVDFLTETVQGITIATDIICGFPTETEQDFDETMSLCEKYKFVSVFINQFYPRPGTPAARMPRVPPNQVKKRTKRLTELFQSYHPYTGMEGKVFDVLVTEKAHDKIHFVGHNKFYHQVLLPGDDSLMGKVVKVEILSTSRHSMTGKVLHVSSVVNDRLRPSSSKSIQSPVIIILLLLIAKIFWIFFS